MKILHSAFYILNRIQYSASQIQFFMLYFSLFHPPTNHVTHPFMTDLQVIEEFERSWEYTREMTTSFIHQVPENKWNFSHHPKFAPLSKQFKHIVKVYGCYVDALHTGSLNMSKKTSMFSGDESRENILLLLKKYDDKFATKLAELKKTGLLNFKIDVFGMEMGLSEFGYVMIQHEVTHFGIWANYAAFAEFETPKNWQSDWKL